VSNGTTKIMVERRRHQPLGTLVTTLATVVAAGDKAKRTLSSLEVKGMSDPDCLFQCP